MTGVLLSHVLTPCSAIS